MKLYRGRYLIAIYDNEDNLIDVACNSNDFLTRTENEMCLISRRLKGKNEFYCPVNKMRYILIDCKEKHNDCFVEEDRKFLDWVGNNKSVNDTSARNIFSKIEIEKLGCSPRTYFRYKKLGKLEKLYQKQGVPYVDTNTTKSCR